MKEDLTTEHWSIAQRYLIDALEAHLDIHCNYYLKNRFIPLHEYLSKRKAESSNLTI